MVHVSGPIQSSAGLRGLGQGQAGTAWEASPSLFTWRLKRPGLDQALGDWTGPGWIGAALLIRPHTLISGQNVAFKSTNSNTWKRCGDTCQSAFLLCKECIRDSSHTHLHHRSDKYVMLLVFFLQPCVCGGTSTLITRLSVFS